MKKFTLSVFILFPTLLVIGISSESFAQNQTPTEPKEVVLKNLDAFNNHDVNAMMQNIAPDFNSYSITPDTTINGVTSRSQLEFTMSGYFINFPNVKSELLDVNTVGRFVYFKERATWGPDGEHSQVSFGVYEVVDGKIQRAWYFQ